MLDLINAIQLDLKNLTLLVTNDFQTILFHLSLSGVQWEHGIACGLFPKPF